MPAQAGTATKRAIVRQHVCVSVTKLYKTNL